jgi:hypothetical protein
MKIYVHPVLRRNSVNLLQNRILEHGLKAGLWIRIGSGFSDFVDPDPYWESGSGSRGKKIKKFQWKKCTFELFLPVPLKGIK